MGVEITNEKGEVIGRGWSTESNKKCQHDFYSCKEHWHGCKNEKAVLFFPKPVVSKNRKVGKIDNSISIYIFGQ